MGYVNSFLLVARTVKIACGSSSLDQLDPPAVKGSVTWADNKESSDLPASCKWCTFLVTRYWCSSLAQGRLGNDGGFGEPGTLVSAGVHCSLVTRKSLTAACRMFRCPTVVITRATSSSSSSRRVASVVRSSFLSVATVFFVSPFFVSKQKTKPAGGPPVSASLAPLATAPLSASPIAVSNQYKTVYKNTAFQQ